MARKPAAARKPTPAPDAGAAPQLTRPARELAPVVPDPDAEPVEVVELAPVFPTEHDALAAEAEVVEADPTLTGHALGRAVAQQLAANGSRAARRRSAVAVALVEHAPLFPTEAHVDDLRVAIPTISDDELRAVFGAGYAAFLASLDAHEPVLVAPDQE